MYWMRQPPAEHHLSDCYAEFLVPLPCRHRLSFQQNDRSFYKYEMTVLRSKRQAKNSKDTRKVQVLLTFSPLRFTFHVGGALFDCHEGGNRN